MALQDLAGVHVLVVEDTDDSREMLRMALEYCGALVTTAASAEEAKRILDSIRPHVLVSDIGMPDDALELIREVKTVAQTKSLHIPAIAITAYQDRREELLAEGFADLVEKPLDPIKLCGVVRRHELKRQIHARLSEGRLGSIAGTVSKSQRGIGSPCVICRRTIEAAEVEREVESAGVCLHAHETCYRLWREESVACRAAAGPEGGRERARRSSH